MEALRAQAERCLSGEPPTPTQAIELAANLLSVLDELETSVREGGHPYRAGERKTDGPDEQPTAVATLERALDETRARLAAAERALTERKNLPPR